MAEAMNGEIKPDVEMKEEGAELSVNPVQAVPPFQPEQQAAEGDAHKALNGELPALNGDMVPEPSQAAQTFQMPEAISSNQGAQEQLQPPLAPHFPVAEPPTASPVPAVIAPTAQVPPPVSAPTPPVVRDTSRPSSIPPAGIAPPERPNAHGSPTRVYLNQNVTPHLLEGMKFLAAYEPEKPLKWLSEFLARRSAETEGES